MADNLPKNYETMSLKTFFGMDDGFKGQRSVPMKVLALGMSRTGTISLKKALLRLGYGKCYHMQELIMRPEHVDFWTKAVRSKWEGGRKPTKAEWDAVLGEYQAGADSPFQAFAEELIALYPNAKVILTNKDPEAFWQSWKKTALFIRDPPFWVKMMDKVNPFRTATRWQYTSFKIMDHQYAGDWASEEIVKKVFQEHYDNVRKWVPKDRLLDYRIEEGWEPLCNFLGESVPDEPFPKGNSSKDFQSVVSLSWKIQAVTLVLKVLILGGGFVGLTRVARMYGLWGKMPQGRLGLGRS